MEPKTITPEKLEEICKTISLSTIVLYLENFRFGKYRLTKNAKTNALYRLNSDFLNTFYTYLFNRGQLEAARNVKSSFPQLNIRNKEWW